MSICESFFKLETRSLGGAPDARQSILQSAIHFGPELEIHLIHEQVNVERFKITGRLDARCRAGPSGSCGRLGSFFIAREHSTEGTRRSRSVL